MFSFLLAATFTFTATATGVEKGTAIEFLVAGQNTDRAYEAMFLLDEPVETFCKRIESAVPLGKPVNPAACRLWPTGCRVRFEPSFERFVDVDREGGLSLVPVFTGGCRGTNGVLQAVDVMPASVFSTYSLAQSLIVFDNALDQGTAYGRFTAAQKLEKGTKVSFKMVVDETSLPRRLDLTAEKGNLRQLLEKLKSASDKDIDATVTFSDSLSVAEALAVAQALAVIDSPRIKINGAHGLFYRAFLPLEKWRDRQERLHQPFELTLKDDGSDELIFIDEDWKVEGDDPKLTPHRILPSQARRYTTTDTCFIYTSKTQTIDRISRAMKGLAKSSVSNWYVFVQD